MPRIRYAESSIYYSRKIFRKTNISYPLIRTCTYVCISGGKKCQFFGKFCVRTTDLTSVLSSLRNQSICIVNHQLSSIFQSLYVLTRPCCHLGFSIILVTFCLCLFTVVIIVKNILLYFQFCYYQCISLLSLLFHNKEKKQGFKVKPNILK